MRAITVSPTPIPGYESVRLGPIQIGVRQANCVQGSHWLFVDIKTATLETFIEAVRERLNSPDAVEKAGCMYAKQMCRDFIALSREALYAVGTD